jgi:transposase
MGHKHSDEFRREAVRIALTSGLTRRQVAADLGIGFSTLSKWIQLDRRDEVLSAPQEDLTKENERLRREVRLLKEERDLLKKATVFFAKQNT